MAKVRLSLDKGRDIFLHRTKIENLFISEYLPDAPGDYVKVFLFGLMYAQYELKPDRNELSRLLGLSVDEIAEAWIYWESRGLVRIVRERDSNNEEVSHVIFLSKIDELYGKIAEPQEDAAPAAADVTEEEDLPIYVSIDDMDFDEAINDKLVDRRLRELYEKYQVTTGRTISSVNTARYSTVNQEKNSSLRGRNQKSLLKASRIPKSGKKCTNAQQHMNRTNKWLVIIDQVPFPMACSNPFCGTICAISIHAVIQNRQPNVPANSGRTTLSLKLKNDQIYILSSPYTARHQAAASIGRTHQRARNLISGSMYILKHLPN